MRSRAPLALIEQTVMVLVFALAAAVCLRVFVWSDTDSGRGLKQDRAAVLAQNAAETVKQAGKDGRNTADALAEAAKELGGVWDSASGELSVRYDSGRNPEGGFGTADGSFKCAYLLTALGTETGISGLSEAHITVTDGENGRVLFELDTAWQREADR